MISNSLQRVRAGESLSMDEMAGVMDAVMQGHCPDDQIGQLLTALHDRGETIEEVAGAAVALRRHMTPIRSRHSDLLDTCGTGGDRSGTFNISTAAALVTAATGVPVAKHGNRGITSKSGSADVLARLGVNIEAGIATVERCLDELGICFCFAPLLHPSMKHVAQIRRQLGIPTIFNLLGPLCNPASAPYQLLGVGRPALRQRLAAALRLLGTRHSAVVCGADGLDEVTLNGVTRVTLVEDGTLRETTWEPGQFGLQSSGLDALQVDGPDASASMIGQILTGQPGPPRDIVVLNAAAATFVAGRTESLEEAAGRASEAIDSGAARRLLDQLIEASQS